MFKITLKNYRCFSDEKPASIDLDTGFTALIGTNNSGKSSFLRFFHEFRNLFQNLIHPAHYQPRQIQIGLAHVEDWLECFHNRNNRQIILEIEDTSIASGRVAKLRCTIERRAEMRVEIDLWVTASSGKLVKVIAGSPTHYRLENNTELAAEPRRFTQFISNLIMSA